MEDENIQEVALQCRRKVPFSKEETLLILRAYELHPSSWTNVLADIKANIEQLSNNHQMLYRSTTPKQLKDRVSNKFGRLLHSNLDTIEDADIRTHVRRVRDLEPRLVPPPPDDNVRQQNDQRELLLQQMSDSDDNDVEGGNRVPLHANGQRQQGQGGDNNAAEGAQPLRQRDAALNNAALDQAQQPVQALPNAAAGQLNRPANLYADEVHLSTKGAANFARNIKDAINNCLQTGYNTKTNSSTTNFRMTSLQKTAGQYQGHRGMMPRRPFPRRFPWNPPYPY